MKTIILEETLPYTQQQVWAIIGDITRADWVPAVDAITELDGVRSFTMAGVGEVQERILNRDCDRYCLQYSAIKTPSNVEHHLATIQLSPAENGCVFNWTTEIAPEQFAATVEQGMCVSLEGLKQVLAGGA